MDLKAADGRRFPMELGSHVVSVTASIGMAIGGVENTTDDLLRAM